MDWGHILAFNVILAAAWISPGPAFLLVLRNTLSQGRRAGVMTGLGLATMASAWTLAALMGLETAFALVPFAYGALKIAGALYLLWVAWNTWKSAQAPIAERPGSGRHAFAEGVMVNLTNPKSVLFAAAVLLVALPADLRPVQQAMVVANHFLFEVIGYAVLSAALATGPVRRGYAAAKPTVDRVAALIMGTLGLRLLVSR